MRNLLFTLALATTLLSHAVSISSTLVTAPGGPAFQLEVTDPLYMPAYYWDNLTSSYPPDGYSYFWQTDEGAISHLEKPIFYFQGVGVHTVHIIIMPRKKDELLVYATYSLTVSAGQTSTESNGIIHNNPAYLLNTPHVGDKLYVVVPLNSCDKITSTQTHHLLFNDSRIQFASILAVAGTSAGVTSPEIDVVLGEPVNSKVEFTRSWTSYRNDVAAVLEFDVPGGDGEPVAIKHKPDVESAQPCGEESEFMELIMVGPYDPNFKESNIKEINVNVVDSSKTNSTEVEYTIHFQNIGNGPVDSITVIDSLPTYLTFVSHTASSLPAGKVNVSTSGNIVTWKLAPDADIRGTTEMPPQADHLTKGWVKFKAKIAPEQTITYDTCYCLCNKATIYFDSLAPITTKADIIAIGDRICFSPAGGKPDAPTNASNICYAPGNYYGTKTAGIDGSATKVSYKKVSVYPNPTSGIVLFDASFIGPVTVLVYNAVGVLVKKSSMNNSELNLSELPQGTYFAHIKDKDTQYVAKVMLF